MILLVLLACAQVPFLAFVQPHSINHVNMVTFPTNPDVAQVPPVPMYRGVPKEFTPDSAGVAWVARTAEN